MAILGAGTGRSRHDWSSVSNKTQVQDRHLGHPDSSSTIAPGPRGGSRILVDIEQRKIEEEDVRAECIEN
jgi:hypothetical protein